MKKILLFLALITATFAQQSQEITVGSTVTLSVTLDALPAGKSYGQLRYQWYKNNSGISGASASTYKFTVNDASALGNYYVIVSNSAGEARAVPVSIQFTIIAPSISPIQVVITK